MSLAAETIPALRKLQPFRLPRSGRPPQFLIWAGFFWLANLAAAVLALRHHPLAAGLTFVAPSPWFIWQMAMPAARGFGTAATSFATAGREVWLTIDDGPDPATTPQMLDLLEAHHARATFFVIGAKAARHPELVAEILRRGHAIGNHTLGHPCFSFWCASGARTAGEIDGATAVLRAAGVSAPVCFRPPAGLKNLALHRTLAERKLPLVLWNVRSFDTLPLRAETVVGRLARKIRPGAIVLLHESGPRSVHHVAILSGLLAHLERAGYSSVLPEPDRLRY